MLTTAQVAQQLAVTPQTINRHAVANGVGTLVTPKCRTFSAADVAKLKRRLKAAESRTQPGSDEMRRRVNVRWSLKIS